MIIENHWYVLQWNNKENQLLFEQKLLVSSGHTSNMAEGSASSSEAVRVELAGDDTPIDMSSPDMTYLRGGDGSAKVGCSLIFIKIDLIKVCAVYEQTVFVVDVHLYTP